MLFTLHKTFRSFGVFIYKMWTIIIPDLLNDLNYGKVLFAMLMTCYNKVILQ